MKTFILNITLVIYSVEALAYDFWFRMSHSMRDHNDFFTRDVRSVRMQKIRFKTTFHVREYCLTIPPNWLYFSYNFTQLLFVDKECEQSYWLRMLYLKDKCDRLSATTHFNKYLGLNEMTRTVSDDNRNSN